MRLFACACVRRIWPLLPGEAFCDAVEVAERFADEEAGVGHLAAALAELDFSRRRRGAAREARTAVWHAAFDAEAASRLNASYARSGPSYNWLLAYRASGQAVSAASRKAARDAREVTPKGGWAMREAFRSERQAQAQLLRDFVASPFKALPALDPAVLAWRDSTVVTLAQAAYEERLLPSGHLDPARLAVLADALEDAGCGDATLLGHLRGPGPHVRGCWAVDVLMGK